MIHLRPCFHLLLIAGLFLTGCSKSQSARPSSAAKSAARELRDMAPASEMPARQPEQGQGPGQGGDKYDLIVENPFLAAKTNPLSTFSIDVDTASYSKTRMFLLEHRPTAAGRRGADRRTHQLLPLQLLRRRPTSIRSRSTRKWPRARGARDHRLVRIGIKGKEMPTQQRPASNLVFLLDVSGSMDQPNKLPLLQARHEDAGRPAR